MAAAVAQVRQVRGRQADALFRRPHEGGASLFRSARQSADGLHRHQLRLQPHAGRAQALRAGSDAGARGRPRPAYCRSQRLLLCLRAEGDGGGRGARHAGRRQGGRPRLGGDQRLHEARGQAASRDLLRFPRKIGHVLLATACGKAPEEEGVENHPAIAYACENADVQTFGTMTVISLRKILAELENLSELSGVHVSRLIQIRHKTTANIKFNLYGGGDRNEGRAALQARDSLDDFIFKAEQTDLVRGQIKETNVLKRAIILETFGELLEILDRGRELGGGTRKGIK